MPIGQGTSQNRYQVEMDGFPLVAATDVTGGDNEHTPFELYQSNVPNPIVGRGNYKITEVTIKHAHSLIPGEEQLFFQWLYEYEAGINTTKINARVVVFDDTGMTPVATWQFYRCTPIKCGPEGLDAKSTEPAYFHIVFRPEDDQLM